MPIPLPGVTRRQRVYDPLLQSAGRVTSRYYDFYGVEYRRDVVKRAGVTRLGSQTTDSEEHPGWKKRLEDANSLQDIGGDFWTQKQYAVGYPTNISVTAPKVSIGSGNSLVNTYQGPAWSIDARLHSFPPSLSSTAAQLDALGATAVARCKPTRSRANIGLTLAELVREGIPKSAVATWRGRTQTERAAAGDYLGYQFGLSPLGSEIGTFAAEVLQADRYLTQYEKDAGKVVRRRYTFPSRIETSTSTAYGTNSPFMGLPEGGTLNPALTPTQQSELKVTRTIRQKRWFSGAFTYYLPPWYDARSEMSRKALLAKEILGLDLDLETAWNLAPWSWAIDWFSNVGDVISNVNDMLEDGLIMRYGYMMEHTFVSDTYTRAYPNVYRDFGGFDSAVTLVTETKIRRKANPFGFGLSWNGLSAYQASILAALGITRGGSKLGL